MSMASWMACAWCTCMSRAKPASAESFEGAPETADEPNVEKRPTANASAAIRRMPSATTSQRRGAPPDAVPDTVALLPAGGVETTRAGRAGLGSVLTAPVLLDELRDALIVGGLQLQLVVPGAEHDRRRETRVRREDEVGRRELALERGQLVARDLLGVVGDPHGTVLHVVHGVLVRDRLVVDAAVQPDRIV